MSPIQIITDDETFEVSVRDAVFVYRRMSVEKKREKMREIIPNPNATDKDGGIDFLEFQLRYLEWCIQDWRGVTHPKTGEAIPCVPENVRRLPEDVQDELVTAMNRRAEETEEESEKN